MSRTVGAVAFTRRSSRINYKFVLVWAVDPCDDDWVFDGDKGCFKLLDGWVTKADGQAACESVGSNLGVPTNSYVADVIVSKTTLTLECFLMFVHSSASGCVDWRCVDWSNHGR